jgi:hypothetical protein
MALFRVLVTVIGAGAFTSRVRASPQCLSPSQHVLSQYQSPLRQSLCVDGDVEPNLSRPVQFEHPVWSHEPFCVQGKDKEYCTHTTYDLRRGHGLSVIARPAAAEAISAALLTADTVSQVLEDGVEVCSFPGKGNGLIATRAIKKGETILLESAHVIVSAQFPAQVTRSRGESLFKAILDQLPTKDREVVMSRDMSLGDEGIENVMKTNSFACQLADGDVGDGYICLFPSVARINHACQPNAHPRFIPKSLSMEIKALRDIEVGEEISISYGNIDMKHTERQRLYKEGWNFTCTCSLCTASPYEITGSDQRRARFAQIRKMLENLTAETYDAQQIVAWEKEVMEISAIEGLDVLLAADYERLAYVYAGHGMVRDARLWAEKAKDVLLEWVAVDGGPENGVRRIEELLGELDG